MMTCMMKNVMIEVTNSKETSGISKSDIKDQADICNIGAGQVLENGDKI